VAVSAALREALPQTGEALNILVVDDHPANCLLLCQQLEFLGHRCAVAEHGAQGLELWLQDHFDLVVADCNMPIMNGYNLTRAIRTHEQVHGQQRCAIWGFTANAQPEEKQRCREAGMDDCLFKPISLTTLNERLNRVHPLEISQEKAPDLSSGRHSETFNMGSVHALTGDRPEMIRRLLEQLLRSSQEDRHELNLIDPQGNCSALSQMAHKIKGAARIIRADRVIETCEAMETACTDAAPSMVIDERLKAMISAMADLERALQEQLASPA